MLLRLLYVMTSGKLGEASLIGDNVDGHSTSPSVTMTSFGKDKECAAVAGLAFPLFFS